MTASMKPPRSAYANKLQEFRDIAFANEQAFAQRDAWRAFFLSRVGSSFDNRVILEIGCADGELLARIARRNPHSAFVGLDWKCKAIYDAASRITRDRLANVAFIRGRAQDVGRMVGQREVDEIWIFHPEPCQRQVERSNRLISEAFLRAAFDILRAERSRVCVKTDHADYYAHILETAALSAVQRRFTIVVNSRDYWADKLAQRRTRSYLFAAEQTAYESRFIRRRKPICYVELARRGDFK